MLTAALSDQRGLVMECGIPKDGAPACGNRCYFWEPVNSVVGQCHRMPPVADLDGMDGHFWPLTGRADWCGEYRPADEDKEGL